VSVERPIGVFDSGVGGLTVLKALRERLPGENFLHLGDTARLPYGTKTEGTIRSQVRLIDSARAVANAVVTDHAEIIDTASGAPGRVHLQLTDASDRFLRIAAALLGREPEHLEVVDIEF
jgi:glutamate racemase